MPAEQVPAPESGRPRPTNSDAGLDAGHRRRRRETARANEAATIGCVPLLLADVGVGGLTPGGAARRRLAAAGGVPPPQILAPVPRPAPIADPCPRCGPPVVGRAVVAGQVASIAALPDPRAARRGGCGPRLRDADPGRRPGRGGESSPRCGPSRGSGCAVRSHRCTPRPKCRRPCSQNDPSGRSDAPTNPRPLRAGPSGIVGQRARCRARPADRCPLRVAGRRRGSRAARGGGAFRSRSPAPRPQSPWPGLDPLAEVPISLAGRLVAGAAHLHDLARHPSEEELAEAGVVRHAAQHYLPDRGRAVAREPRRELLAHQRPPGPSDVRPPRTLHAAAVADVRPAIAPRVPHRGGKRTDIVAPALVDRAPAISRTQEHAPSRSRDRPGRPASSGGALLGPARRARVPG